MRGNEDVALVFKMSGSGRLEDLFSRIELGRGFHLFPVHIYSRPRKNVGRAKTVFISLSLYFRLFFSPLPFLPGDVHRDLYMTGFIL